jgi:hypothetical protein
VSPAKRGGRFSYLTNAGESPQANPADEEGKEQETEGDSAVGCEESLNNTDSRSGGEEERSNGPSTQELSSVPKGTGRMKQERSQLNVRIPTILKRRTSAKAMLEGRDIGEVVEELLRKYLDR